MQYSQGQQVDHSDPLGLTQDQRAEGEIITLRQDLMDRIQENMDAFGRLPAGTRIVCPVCKTTHPVEAYR